MPLVAQARTVGTARHAVDVSIQVYIRRAAQAEGEFRRRGGLALERAVRALGPVAPLVTPGGVSPLGAYAGIVTALGTSVCHAAHNLDTANTTLAQRAQSLRTMAEATSRVTPKIAQYVAQELLWASYENRRATTLLGTHRQSRWARYDTSETPLILLAFRTPERTTDWVGRVYTTLVGEEYAVTHPFSPASAPTPDNGNGNGFQVSPWVWTGLGLFGAAALIIRDMRK